MRRADGVQQDTISFEKYAKDMNVLTNLFSCQVVSDSFVTPMDCTPPGSSVHGIFQARIPELLAISFSRDSLQSRDWTHISFIGRQALAGGFPGPSGKF